MSAPAKPTKKRKIVSKKKKAAAEGPAKPRRAATLEEPVYVTLGRDLKMIGVKLSHVLIPRVWSSDSKGVEALRDWDLWGPLLISLILGIACTFLIPKSKAYIPSAAVFAAAFTLPWLGAIMVVLNSILLGGSMSFFQAVSLIGYCIFPLTVSAVICAFFPKENNKFFIAKLIVCLVGFVWGTLASVGFFAGLLPPKRKALGVFPLFLLFAIIAWLILSL